MIKPSLIALFLLVVFCAKAQENRSPSSDKKPLRVVSTSMKTSSMFKGDSVVAESSGRVQVRHKSSDKRYLDYAKANSMPQTPWIVKLSAGISTMPWYLDSYSTSSPDYIKDLKRGIHIDGSIHYLIQNCWGLGVEYSFLGKSSSGIYPQDLYYAMFSLATEECRQYQNYLGVSLMFQHYLDIQQKCAVRATLSGGKLFMRLESEEHIPNMTSLTYVDFVQNSLLTGASFCGKLGLAFDYRLWKGISVGVGASFLWCSMKTFDYKSNRSDGTSSFLGGEEFDEAMNLSRFDGSLSLSYSF